MSALHRARLYGIIDFGYTRAERALSDAASMIEGGVGIIQLRAKKETPAALLPVATELARLCRGRGVPFIINDHPRLAIDCMADGVHVGQDDLSVTEVRRLIGPGKIIGLSTHSPAQARAAVDQQPDYIGFGPLFATPTKADYQPVGTGDIAAVYASAPFPVFCIGGIKRENLAGVLAAGACRVVIVSGILQAPDIASYCRECLNLLGQTDSAPN